MDPFTVHGVVPHSTKHGCHVVVTSFTYCSSRQQSTKVESDCVGVVCVWASWRRPGALVSFSVWFALFVPYPSKAVRSC